MARRKSTYEGWTNYATWSCPRGIREAIDAAKRGKGGK